jgi:DNA-binding transcriptional MerR regulator
VATKASKRGFLRSGELAKVAGVSTDTLRHDERLGVLPAARRRANGYREYGPDAIEHLRLVRSALAVGFTLTELASIFELRRRGGAPCREVRDLAADKLAHLEVLLRDITEVRNQLRATLKDWDRRLEKAGTGEPARLLEALASSAGGQRQSNPVSGRFGPRNGNKRKP